MALESLPKIAPALFSAEQDLIQIYNKKSDTVGTINASYIGGSTPPSGVSGAIQFSNGSAFASDASNLFWNNTTKRLGIGTNAPITAVDVNGSIRAGVNLTVVGEIQNPTVGVVNINGELRVASPNVSIGLTSYPARLAVRGSGSTAATTALLVQNSLGNNALTIKDDLSATFSNTVYGGGFVFAAVSELYLNCRVTTTNPVNPQYRLFSSEGNASQTIAPTTSFHDIRDFTPTSGSALYTSFEYSGTINQTGGANGITRGLYINPTLTAAADFRAIEATQGNVLLATTSGRVGIGTNAPNTTAHFKGGVAGAVGTRIATLEGSLPELLFKDTSSNDGFAITKYGTVIYFTNTNASDGYTSYSGLTNTSRQWSLGHGSNPLATVDIKGGGSTGATTSLLVKNSLGTNVLAAYDDTSVSIGGQNGAVTIISGYNNYFAENTLHFYSAATNIRGMYAGGQGLIISKNTGTTDLYPSAILAIDSTTQGFLPPRMTDAQIRIIATPAVGLMAYNTDLDCPVFYSAAGWRKVSHSVM